MIAIFVANRILLLFQFHQIVTAAVSPITIAHHQQPDQIMMATTSTSSSSSSRKALSISDLWTMNEPTLVLATNDESNSNNDNKRFHLTYEVNDMIEDTMFTSTFWATTDCSSGKSPLSEEGLGYRFITTNNGVLSAGDGSNVRTFHVVFEITDEISVRDNPNIYTIDDNDNDNDNDDENGNNKNSRIVVCVRSSLNTMNGNEVNYLESIIQFRYVYENGFSVANDITLTARDDAADTVIEDERSIVDAYDCTDDPIGNTKNIKGEGKGKGQGTLLRLCVQPKPNALISGFRMKAIENYRYETKVVNEEGGGGEEEQQIVQYAVENRVQTEKNDLTRLTCIRGQGQCVIETLLNAAFYSQQREVYGKGTVTYQLGQEDGSTGSNSGDNNGRRLRRGLQAAATDGIDDNRFEQVEWEIIDVIFVVEKDDSDYDENKKKGEGLQISRYTHSNNASIVIIILIVSNLMAGIVHFVDYRQQHKVVEHMEKLYEN